MKNTILTSLALILLQCTSTAYAGFSLASISGPYGGSFSGDLFATEDSNIGPVGNMTMTFNLIANGANKAVGTAFVIVQFMVSFR